MIDIFCHGNVKHNIYLVYKKIGICSKIANETTIHQISNKGEISNYRQPYDLYRYIIKWDIKSPVCHR